MKQPRRKESAQYSSLVAVRWPAVVNQAGLLHSVTRPLINLPDMLARSMKLVSDGHGIPHLVVDLTEGGSQQLLLPHRLRPASLTINMFPDLLFIFSSIIPSHQHSLLPFSLLDYIQLSGISSVHSFPSASCSFFQSLPPWWLPFRWPLPLLSFVRTHSVVCHFLNPCCCSSHLCISCPGLQYHHDRLQAHPDCTQCLYLLPGLYRVIRGMSRVQSSLELC